MLSFCILILYLASAKSPFLTKGECFGRKNTGLGSRGLGFFPTLYLPVWSWATCFISPGSRAGGWQAETGSMAHICGQENRNTSQSPGELFKLIKMTMFLIVHLGQALLTHWECGGSGEGRKQQVGTWPWGLGDHTLRGRTLLLTAVSIEQPWYLDSPHHQPPERLLRGEKCCSESRRWQKPTQIHFMFLCYVLPRDTPHKGRNESFSFSTGLKQTISWLRFSNFL